MSFWSAKAKPLAVVDSSMTGQLYVLTATLPVWVEEIQMSHDGHWLKGGDVVIVIEIMFSWDREQSIKLLTSQGILKTFKSDFELNSRLLM